MALGRRNLGESGSAGIQRKRNRARGCKVVAIWPGFEAAGLYRRSRRRGWDGVGRGSRQVPPNSAGKAATLRLHTKEIEAHGIGFVNSFQPDQERDDTVVIPV